MSESVAVQCRATQGVTWVLCPVCRAGKVQKLAATTRARSLTVFCRRCKHESVIDVEPLGTGGGPRVTLAFSGHSEAKRRVCAGVRTGSHKAAA